MKKKMISFLLLTLILTSTVNVAFIIRSTFAQSGENNVLGNDFMEKINASTSPNKDIKPDQSNDLSDNWRNIYERKPDTKQDKTLENSSQTSRYSGDRWNFNETSEWSNFAYVDGNKTRLIVGINSEKPKSLLELEKIVAKHKAKIVNTVSIGGEIRAVVVELFLALVTAFAEEVRVEGLASYIEPNMKFQAQLVPNDPYWSLQWGPQKIEADWAWNTTVGDPTVLVAVVDTGIYYTHPDIAANYVPLGYDWVNNDTDPMDDHGHGTHCAGIIAATLNNSVGIAGLAQVQVMAEKVLDSGGYGYDDWIANGIINATDCGADIISMSLGGYGESELVHEAVKYAYDAGVLVIAAAGNDNTNMKLYPAGYDEVVAVAATDQSDNKAWFSNWGDWIELAAPGVDIYSTVPWGYESWSGTSMATPHVSGVAALVWSLYPDKTRDWVRLWLRYAADDLGDEGFDVYYGYGRVNARKAVEQTPPAHELIAWEWETPPYVEPEAIGIINATILNFGENDETDITVQLLANGTMIDHTSISFLTGGHSTTVNLLWNPTVEGLCNLTLYVVPVPEETSLENNVLWKYIYVGFPVKAVVLHSAGNVYGDIITNWQALTNEWYLFGDTMIYIDYTTLNKEGITYEDIVATEADVLIISCAYDPGMGWQFTDSEIEAIEQYVYEGHGLIATAGTLYYQVPNNNKLAPLFGLNETTEWTSTGTDLLHLLNTTHPIFTNVPNPLVFPQVGNVLPYDGRWDSNELFGGKYLALGHYQESAIVVYRGLVYISPWLEIIPPYYHHHLQLLYNAITWSRYQKPEHELAVSMEAPKRLNPGEPTLLNATVFNRGRSNETGVELQLFIDGALVDSVTITELLVDSSYTLSHLWTPTVQSVYNVTAYAPPISGEEFTKNNIAEKKVMVLLITVEKVLVYTDDYVIAPSSRYVILALDNLGITYTHYSDDPSGFGAALVSQPWDLVVVDHCNYYAMGYYWTELEEYVCNGGLLVLSTFDIDGSHSEPTTLWDTLGVRWVSDMQYPEPVYRWMPSHPIFTFPNIIGDLTSYMEAYSDDGDHVTCTTGTPIAGFTASPSDGYASVVVGNVYQTVLFSFILDEFRYDQNGDRKLDAVELWENAIIYVSTPAEHDIAVNIKAPISIKPSQSALLNATVSNKGLSNETDVELQILVNGTVVQSAAIDELLTGDSYTLSHLWTPTVEGIYNVTAYALPVPGEDNIQNNVKSARVTVSTLLVALFQNYDSWGYPSNEEALERYDVPYVVFRSSDFGRVDLSTFTKVVISSDQDQAFYNGMNTYRWWFEDYVSHGGILEIHAADWGWHGGQWIGPLPGGLQWASYSAQYVTVVDPAHPLLSRPNIITEAELDNWNSAVHGYFSVYPVDAHVIIIEDSTGMPAYLEFGYGSGFVIASSQTLEWAYKRRLSLILENSLLYMPVKYEHDLSVSSDAPTCLELGNSVMLNVTVRNRGLHNETGAELYLLINGTVVNSTIITELLVGESYTINHLWTPIVEGTYNVTAYAPPLPDEGTTANNIAAKTVNVRPIKYVLFDQTHGTDSITSYSIWVTSLTSRGYVVEIHTVGPITPIILEEYDVLVIPQAHDSYTADELFAIQNFVFNGGGLLVIGDDNPWIYTDLTGFAGITWESGGTSGITTDITPHPVTTGVASVYLDAPIAIIYVTEAAQDLVRDPARNIMLAASEQMCGKVLGFADEDSLWDYAISQADNLLLANNMIDWLAILIRYEHDLAVTLDAPKFFELGSSTVLNATVLNKGLNNETDVELYLLINDTVVSSTTISKLLISESYTINYTWVPMSTGSYNVTAYAAPVPEEEYVTNNVVTKWTCVFFYTRLHLPHEWIGGGNPMGWHADDASWPYTLPFDFPFYGICYRTIYISSNGLITFLGPDSSCGNSMSSLAQKLAIAPAWDDWVTYDPYDIYIWQNSTRVGIRWYVRAYGSDVVANFEAILRNDGTIQFNYGYNNGTISATVGISNGVGHILADDLASLNYFNTIIFDVYRHDVAIQDMSIHPAQVYARQTVNINVTALNEGDVPESFNVTLYYTRVGNSSIPPEPHPGNSMWIEPSTTDLQGKPVGYKFNITLWVNLTNVPDPGSEVGAWQALVVYNSALFNFSRYDFTARTAPTDPIPNTKISEWFKNAGTWKTMAKFDCGSFNATHNFVMPGELWLSPDYGDPENPKPGEGSYGSLVWIELQLISLPEPAHIDYIQYITTGVRRCKVFDENNIDIAGTFSFYPVQITFGAPPPPPLPPYRVVIGVQEVINLPPNSSTILTFAWNTTGTPLGTYFMNAIASVVMGEVDVKDNIYTGGTVELLSMHDVSIVNVSASRTWVYKSHDVDINVTVRNSGDLEENVAITVYYNITAGEAIGAQEVENLLPNESRTITLTWNTTGVTPCRNYTITAVAIIREPDKKPTDNVMESLEKVNVRILGDTNGDSIVDIADIYAVAVGFGETPNSPRWNPDLDINNDGIIDIDDIYIVAINFGKIYSP